MTIDLLRGMTGDRIQLVKGWVEEKGEPHEKIFDLAWSRQRVRGADGKLPPVGNTVDLAKGTYANTIGSAELLGS